MQKKGKGGVFESEDAQAAGEGGKKQKPKKLSKKEEGDTEPVLNVYMTAEEGEGQEE